MLSGDEKFVSILPLVRSGADMNLRRMILFIANPATVFNFLSHPCGEILAAIGNRRFQYGADGNKNVRYIMTFGFLFQVKTLLVQQVKS